MPVCRLMISCPSDVKTEIEIINRVVDNINDSIGFSMNIFVKTLYWSKNVMPEAGEYPQSIINKHNFSPFAFYLVQQTTIIITIIQHCLLF